jgi:alkylation response protein AidB-like acyl-CoA dehydrogenase
MVVKTVEQVGTEEQKREYIGGALRGEILIALGYSEPDSGSDVAAAKTTAVRDGDEVHQRQKMFKHRRSAATCSCRPHRPERAQARDPLFMVPTASEATTVTRWRPPAPPPRPTTPTCGADSLHRRLNQVERHERRAFERGVGN